MKTFLDGLKDWVLVLNDREKVEFGNYELLNKLGYTLEELKKRDINNLFEDKDINDLMNTYIIDSDGNKIRVKLNIHYNDWHGESAKFIIVHEEKNDIDNVLCQELVSEIKKREYSQYELEEFMITAMDIIAILSPDGRILKVNKEASGIFGWSNEELCNMKWVDMMYPEDVTASEREVIEIINSNEDVNIRVYRFINKFGEVVWLECRFKYNKKKGLMISTARNITQLKKMDEVRIEYEKAFHLESIKNEFFANISHEFKTPLNIILATMQFLDLCIKNEKLTFIGEVDFDKYRKSIVQNSYRLLRLVNNLIDITKLDSGVYKLALQNENIVYVIEDITMSVAEYVENKGIELIFDTEVEEVITACDLEKVERIMLNLLSNAIKYVGDNGVIKVYIKLEDDLVVVSVKDNGIGIPKEKLENIFDRFVQVDNILTRKCEGSGIGLSIVKSLINLHDGDIDVESEEGKGTEFTFTLPVRTIEERNANGCKSNLKTKIEKCNIEFSDIYNQ